MASDAQLRRSLLTSRRRELSSRIWCYPSLSRRWKRRWRHLIPRHGDSMLQDMFFSVDIYPPGPTDGSNRHCRGAQKGKRAQLFRPSKIYPVDFLGLGVSF
jgi:hypothetical protein